MIELVRSWLLGVTGVAIFTAMAEGLMPEGTVKQVGKLTGGLVLLVAALTPVLSLDLQAMLPSDQWKASLEDTAQALELERKNQWEAIIVEELEAYIVDKAEEQGVGCTATVTCHWEGEIFLPDTAIISGIMTDQQERTLREMMVEALGIEAEHITVTKEGVE